MISDPATLAAAKYLCCGPKCNASGAPNDKCMALMHWAKAEGVLKAARDALAPHEGKK